MDFHVEQKERSLYGDKKRTEKLSSLRLMLLLNFNKISSYICIVSNEE